MKYFLILILTLFLISCSEDGYAEDGEVYYCSEIKKVGFAPSENFKQYNMTTNRYKILIDFEKKYIQSKDLFFVEYNTRCIDTLLEELFCSNNAGTSFSINKDNLKFSVSIVSSLLPIYVSHGECEVF